MTEVAYGAIYNYYSYCTITANSAIERISILGKPQASHKKIGQFLFTMASLRHSRLRHILIEGNRNYFLNYIS